MLHILTVVDTHSRYCLAADAGFTYRGEDVVQTLEGICRKTGYPRTIRVDHGRELICELMGWMPPPAGIGV